MHHFIEKESRLETFTSNSLKHKMDNSILHIDCINMYGIIHQNEKGYNVHFVCLLIVQNILCFAFILDFHEKMCCGAHWTVSLICFQ